jgi:hypothetical protein
MSLSNRIEKLEQMQSCGAYSLVALQTANGFIWDGQTYPDEAAFDTALLMSGACGRLVVLDEG